MLSFAIIIFREVLEIALILGVVLAATRELPRRGRWIGLGLLAGIVGSGAVALFAGALSEAVSGIGHELFDSAVLLLAAGLIGWHVVWMKRHSRHLAGRLTATGHAVAEGKSPFYVMTLVVGLAVLREGSEIVLLTYGVMVSGHSVLGLLTGGLIGVVAGSLTGAAIYLGLARMATRYVFPVTGAMVTFLAAGMVSQAVEKLDAAGILSGSPLWDTSHLLSERSALGTVLHTLVGYSAQPTAPQFTGYVLTLLTIALFMKLMGSRREVAPQRSR